MLCEKINYDLNATNIHHKARHTGEDHGCVTYEYHIILVEYVYHQSISELDIIDHDGILLTDVTTSIGSLILTHTLFDSFIDHDIFTNVSVTVSNVIYLCVVDVPALKSFLTWQCISVQSK